MLRRISVLYTVGVCLLSIIAHAAILPQLELRELDIFLQDDGYNQISRTKRTDNNSTATDKDEEEETSEYASVGPIAEESTETTTDFSLNQTDAPGNLENVSENELVIPLLRSSANGEGPPPEIPPQRSANVSYLVQPRDPEANLTATSHLEEAPQTLQTTEAKMSDNLITNTTEVNTITSTEIPVTELASTENLQENVTQLPLAFPLPPDPKMDINSNIDSNAAAENSTDTIDSPKLDDSTESQNATDSSGDNLKPSVPDNSPPVVQNTTSIIKNNTKSDVSHTVTGGNQATTTKNVKNSTDVTTSKPVVGESDAVNKANVSGSGILLTIIILVVVAGLAGLGYYFYKKRQRGYDPVEVEDRDKEMTEIKTENGFGKPILAEEVKLQDQLTPLEPKPTPRTFGVASLHEEAFGNVDVIREDSDRDQREQSVEFEEEGVKKDEKY